MTYTTGLVVGAFTTVAITMVCGSPAKAQTQRNIHSCPYDITTPGVYLVPQDLTGCTPYGIRVSSSNVTVLLDGHSISGALAVGPVGTVGIEVRSQTSLVAIVGPGKIQGFKEGIDATSSKSVVALVTVTGLTGVIGFAIRGSEWALIGNTVTTGEIELLQLSSSVVFRNNVSGGPGAGIFLALSSNNNTLYNNTVTTAQNAGIVVLDGSNNKIYGNTTRSNRTGIEIAHVATDNNITGNTSDGNTVFDLQDDNASCDHNTWRNNTFGRANQSCIQ